MTKKKEALDKAKESGKKIIKGGKRLGKGTVEVIGGTAQTIGYTIASAGEAGTSRLLKKKRHLAGRARKHISKAGKGGKKALSGAGDMLAGGASIVGHTVETGYHLINAGDNAIGDEIERRRPGKVGKFLRNNLIKLMIALSALGYGGHKTTEILGDKQGNQQELVKKGEGQPEIIQLSEDEQYIMDFFTGPDVINDLGSSGKNWQDRRETRYLGEDEAWNKMRNGFGYAERKKVIDGLCRMIESGDLKMILEKADKAGVPRQCVFLALAESGWQAGADSGVAGGYRQFTKDSAKRFGLIDSQGNDYRSDPEKSTDAAMKHLKENYKIVCNYAKQLGYNLSESDKWIFAFHMYNGSPKLVKKGMIACKGNANEYSEKQGNTENRNYVPRILAIQDALRIIFEENGYDINKIKVICLNQKIVEKTKADLMYEEFIKAENTMNKEEKIGKLNEIRLKYEEEYKAGVISETYYKGAIRVIEEQKDMEDDE